LTLAEAKGASFINKSYIVEYFFVQIVVNLFSSSWHGTFVGQRIKTGEMSSFLLKPLEYIWYYIASNLAEKVWKIAFSLGILIILGMVYKDYLHIPIGKTFFPAVVVIILATTLRFLNQHVLGLSAFWLTNVRAVVDFNDMIGVIMSGRLFPLRYATKVIPEAVLTFLPYQYMIGFPIDVILGVTSGAALLSGIGMQCLWVVVYSFIYRILWRKGLRMYGGYGG